MREEEFDLQKSYWQQLFNDAEDYPLDLAWAWVDANHYMVEDILAKVDRASMAVALEVRVPLLDHTVVETCQRLSRSMKVKGKTRKWILKEILSSYVPRKMWDRPKQGFGAPMDKWLNGPLNSMLHDYLSPKRLSDQNIFDVSYIEKLIRDHESGRKDNQYYLWTLLMWEMWRDYAGE